ncbi:alpha/beta hydrolase [Mycolicibacterium neworleansense]|uniref:Monooxygenase n=1 Tax=Mycolicibacterium neworleansense TaxID=146018 RepID=A0A0H5RKV9_9MYCO|nr:alpha/beta hydrolase [Mycolicibacterium neworleansense]MCV7360487.1 alpha/beta hydrolase [Mycolicibacterium neworleansense]CRZ14658.1 monooxygenase [Mycolicibacterium neworleansense]
MPLEPVTQALLAQLAETRDPPMHEGTPAMARMAGPIFAGMSGRGPEVAAVHNLKLEGEDGGRFRVRVVVPDGQSRSVIVYFHGGGWVIGDIDLQYDHLARHLANLTESTVVLVNYRKAPEHPFPTALEDSWIGLLWAAAHSAEFAPADAPLIVAGDSAGGNIAAVMARWARDRQGPTIDYQALIYPVTDCDFDRPSYVAPENQLMLSRDTMIWFWAHYLSDPAARTNPDASPLRAPSLAGLPPALVYVAEYDPLHDEGVAYAAALAEAGVSVTLEEAAGQMHGYFQMANILPGYQAGMSLVANHIRAFVDGYRTDLKAV